jgi:hypothetical protein
MLGLPTETLTIVAVLVLMAVAVGTFSARFFIAASRSHAGGVRPDKDI